MAEPEVSAPIITSPTPVTLPASDLEEHAVPQTLPPQAKLNYESDKRLPRPVVILLGLVLVAIIGLLFYQNYSLKSRLATSSSPIPLASAAPMISASPDPTAGWRTYKNDKQNISFKYPESWDLTETPGSLVGVRLLNQNVTLSSGPASISMNLDMDGIGGKGFDVEGESYLIDGNKLYQYQKAMENGNLLVGITDTLKETLGVFTIKGKTYSISLVYPANSTSNTYKQDFDQILSTFQFTAPEKLQMGLVKGKLCYPSDFIPKGEIVLKNLATGATVEQKISLNNVAYSLSVPVGNYHIRYQAHASGQNPDSYVSGYYTACAKNENICIQNTSHELIPLKVEDNIQLNNINLCDFGNSEEQTNVMNSKFEQ